MAITLFETFMSPPTVVRITDGGNTPSALGLDPNVAAGLAYIPICAVGLIMSIIIIVTDKTNKLARFHAFQSLLLAATWIVLYIAVVVVFPGSNCDHDAYHVVSKHVGQPVDFIWHKETDLSGFDAAI